MCEVHPDIDEPTDDELFGVARDVVSLATSFGLTLGTAESCTGGMVCASLTEVPGSSAAVRGGVVSYAIDVKHEVLGVSREVLDAPGVGAVSGECASAMCDGARRVLGCDLAVSITGIAGPGGEEPGKPVGTVWFGVCSPLGTQALLFRFMGDRRSVRRKANLVALQLLHRELTLLA
jgi:nicotinamide-nucleotide amidase